MNVTYPGINPYLNSALLQPEGGWRSFHAAYIIYLFDALDATLPPNYYAQPEESLQIATYDVQEKQSKSKPIADVLILNTGEGESVSAEDEPTPTMTLSIPQPETEDIQSVVIYEGDGKPVTRIEMLSPANKPGGSHYIQYLDKRDKTLRSGLRVVEIDFIHTYPPMLPRIPDYTRTADNSKPYHILITDPRPKIEAGKTDVYSFGVLDSIPTLPVPLEGRDTIKVQFGTLYQQTADKRPFRQIIESSANLSTYTSDDQAAILAFVGGR
jgi:hypothetical protein